MSKEHQFDDRDSTSLATPDALHQSKWAEEPPLPGGVPAHCKQLQPRTPTLGPTTDACGTLHILVECDEYEFAWASTLLPSPEHAERYQDTVF